MNLSSTGKNTNAWKHSASVFFKTTQHPPIVKQGWKVPYSPSGSSLLPCQPYSPCPKVSRDMQTCSEGAHASPGPSAQQVSSESGSVCSQAQGNSPSTWAPKATFTFCCTVGKMWCHLHNSLNCWALCQSPTPQQEESTKKQSTWHWSIDKTKCSF